MLVCYTFNVCLLCIHVPLALQMLSLPPQYGCLTHSLVLLPSFSLRDPTKQMPITRFLLAQILSWPAPTHINHPLWRIQIDFTAILLLLSSNRAATESVWIGE
jgi:hypothetical protein